MKALIQKLSLMLVFLMVVTLFPFDDVYALEKESLEEKTSFDFTANITPSDQAEFEIYLDGEVHDKSFDISEIEEGQIKTFTYRVSAPDMQSVTGSFTIKNQDGAGIVKDTTTEEERNLTGEYSFDELNCILTIDLLSASTGDAVSRTRQANSEIVPIQFELFSGDKAIMPFINPTIRFIDPAGEREAVDDRFLGKSLSSAYDFDIPASGEDEMQFIINYYYTSQPSNIAMYAFGKITGTLTIDSAGNVSVSDITGADKKAVPTEGYKLTEEDGTQTITLGFTASTADPGTNELLPTAVIDYATQEPDDLVQSATYRDEDGSQLYCFSSAWMSRVFVPRPATKKAGDIRNISYEFNLAGYERASGTVTTNGADKTWTIQEDAGYEALEFDYNNGHAIIKLKPAAITEIEILTEIESPEAAKLVVYKEGVPQTESIKIKDIIEGDTEAFTYEITAPRMKTIEGSFTVKNENGSGILIDTTTEEQKMVCYKYKFDVQTGKITARMIPAPELEFTGPGYAEVHTNGLWSYCFPENIINTGGEKSQGKLIIQNNSSDNKAYVVTGYRLDEMTYTFNFLMRTANDMVEAAGIDGTKFSKLLLDVGIEEGKYYELLLKYYQDPSRYDGKYENIQSLDEVNPLDLADIWGGEYSFIGDGFDMTYPGGQYDKWIYTNTGSQYIMFESDQMVIDLAKRLFLEYGCYISLDGEANGLTNGAFSITYKGGNPEGLSLNGYATASPETTQFVEEAVGGKVIRPGQELTLDHVAMGYMGDILHNGFLNTVKNYDIMLTLLLKPVGVDGYMYEDTDDNGVFTLGTDKVFSGVNVDLLNNQNQVVETVRTDEGGYYYFDSADANGYKVRITVPGGHAVAASISTEPEGNHFHTMDSSRYALTDAFDVTGDGNYRNNAELIEKENGGGGGGGTSYYTVYYEAGNGVHNAKNIPDNDTRLSAGATYTVKGESLEPSREGYAFEGWKVTKDASNDLKNEYWPGNTFKMPSNDVTLTAIWEQEGETAELNKEDHYAYVVGYPDGNVKPNEKITRAESATILFRLLTETSRERYWSTSSNFPDVTKNAWFNNAISTMTKANIVRGYPDGSFRPNENITRAEYASLIAKFDKSSYDKKNYFNDVSGHWAENYINQAAAQGWLEGYPDGSFKPNEYITRAEVMTLVNKVLERNPEGPSDLISGMIKWPDNVDQNTWYYLAVQEATNSHLHEKKVNGKYEKWTALEKNPDWAAIESSWSQTYPN